MTVTWHLDSELEDDAPLIIRDKFLYKDGVLHFLNFTDTSAKVEMPFFKDNVISEVLHELRINGSTRRELRMYMIENYQDLISEVSNEKSWTDRSKELYTLWELICRSEFSSALKSALGSSVNVFSLELEYLNLLEQEDLSNFLSSINDKLWEVKPENRLEYFAGAITEIDTSGLDLQTVVMLDSLIKECYSISEKWKNLYD